MRIQFDDRSYVDLQQIENKIVLIVSARDYDNPRKKITNTVELTMEEFKQLISDIKVDV